MTSRIKGPGDGPRKVDGPDAVDGAEGVDEAQAAGRAGEVAGKAKVGPSDAIGRVAAQLRAGEIDVERAVELLIEHTVAQQGSAAGPELKEKLGEVLRRYVKDDPLLAARIQKLSLRK